MPQGARLAGGGPAPVVESDTPSSPASLTILSRARPIAFNVAGESPRDFPGPACRPCRPSDEPDSSAEPRPASVAGTVASSLIRSGKHQGVGWPE
jgi:hypothetical protein